MRSLAILIWNIVTRKPVLTKFVLRLLVIIRKEILYVRTFIDMHPEIVKFLSLNCGGNTNSGPNPKP